MSPRPVIKYTESDRPELVGETVIRGQEKFHRPPDWLYNAIAMYVNPGWSKPDSKHTPVHCDALTLHKPGLCEYCDKYGEARQKFRIEHKIPFSGQPGAPDALFRPDETINRWGGNRPWTKEELETEDANWKSAFYEYLVSQKDLQA